MRTSRWLVATYTVIIVLGLLIALPNVLPQSVLQRVPAWLPHEQVSLGLDLRGGSHLVLEVDEADLTKERLQSLLQDARRVLREKGIQPKAVVRSQNQIVVTLADAAQSDAAVTELKTLANPISTGLSAGQADLDVTANGATITVGFSRAGIAANVDNAVQQSLEVIRQRVDQVGVSEPTIQRIGANRVLVQLPGAQDPSRLRELLGSTAKMSFHMLSPNNAPGPGVTMLKDDEGRSYPVLDRVEISGDRLSDARVSFDPNTREPIVSFRFDSAGATRFAEITRQNVGNPFAIVLDDKVLSAPVIREPITGGSGQISGSFSADSATTLAAMLRAGALPAKLTVIEERTVGADLGADAIRMGIYSGIVGFVLVAAFIFVLYGTWGFLANIALLIHTILTFSALTLVGATLTLPGIAGVVLGIGLAVDANVLINERIREETRKGKSAFAAIDTGFRRAYSTIIDGNMTALIAAAILFFFGSGPVRGFAVTMALGLIISMFTSVAFVRVAMIEITRRRKLKVLNIRPLIPFSPYDKHIEFMKARFFGVTVSALLSIASVVLFIHPGLNYGVDFRGGIQMAVKTQGAADLAKFREGLDSLGLGEITLQSFGDKSSILVRAQRQEGGEEAQTAAVTKLKAEVTKIDPTATVEGTDVIGPKVSGELAWAGILSVVIASFAMLIYIWVRFEWPFAVGAIVTLVLDVTKAIGFFAITGLDFNLTAIAAILTLVGYSVNDKVVVYDRMRENMRLYKSMPLREIIDKSINETLARSLYTNATAFLALVPMAIWGGSAVSSFAIPMVFGILVAGASSIFIAAPILLFLGDWRRRHAKAAVATDEAVEIIPPEQGRPRKSAS
ncbi:protein translocase subunit SecD [Rhizobium johnstonii]|uniref:Multifunctional fusion protein n=1 Tax=Rhizobium leguminosarum bv. viciae TaxID=387 RepID=A0A8G2MP97_RHILV|nr:protein translocase subunit SecD [Rhizobium leguminosarum]MBY5320251.1 protein translocase subunit SecD [Rhizobium leguminosarum]MBY5379501.1 protein translocase subunit SecD [Rhizobium leguminosarum]MBY5423511.1 protein translocase subunit SecD [Rhizobium leguminosarum]MCA2431438.1 protein translocase subunit SecD [Rhizobium leguminosarum]NEH41686.1 protein translocase subunit SecD [Rhizobium leguminosarum]